MDITQKPREERRPTASGKQSARPDGAQPRTPQRPEGEKAAAPRQTEEKRPAQRPASAQRRESAPRQSTAKRPDAPERAPRVERPAGEPRRRPQERPDERKNAAPKKKSAPKKAAAPRKNAEKRRTKEKTEDISTKKRAYGNSKPKKKSAAAVFMESIQKTAKKNAEKRKKKKSSHPTQPAPAVIYTAPAAFNRNRLIIHLVTVTAVVLALVIGLSVFFKVEHIYVSGAEVYSESAITEVCGISKGDNLLTFSHARAAALIQANRPYVREVRFGIKLPDTVNIIIEEDDVVYAIKDETGQWWLINSSGRVVEQGNSAKVSGNTQILGVSLDNPVPNEQAVALESAPAVTESTDAQGETVQEVIPVTTTGAQRLDATLQILKALENNDIVGEAASVDVSRVDDIILWYGTRYQVNLGDSSRLDYKIACMNSVIAQMSEYQSGILDCSFTIWPNQVGYTPFS